MKTKYFIGAALLLLLMVIPLIAPAQMTMNPNGQYLYYKYTFINDRSYADGKTDTIPNSAYGLWYASTTVSTRLGGASYITLEIDPAY